ncbi:MAG: heterodisulfide reductase-related iron-sulfur binding cluster [Planctomycetota bacterium]
MLHNINVDAIGPRGEAAAAAVAKCVHCGFCLPGCPTYQEMGSEMDSPRGRILLMKNVLEGELEETEARPHIDRCLGCLACVTNCPSGVEYGELLSTYRDHTEAETGRRKRSLRDTLVRWTLPFPNRFRLALKLAKWTQFLNPVVPSALRPMLEMVPDAIPKAEPIPERTPAIGKRRGRVAMMLGCAQNVLAPDINAAAIRVLSLNGIEVLVPRGQGCCGALFWHTGEGEAAKKFAKDLIRQVPKDVDCFLTTAAGCGSAVHEYPLLLAGDEQEIAARELQSKSMDISLYLSQVGIVTPPAIKRPLRIAFHDACHLAHAQGVRGEPRDLLRAIPGVEIAELRDSDICCGSAGTYNIEQPELANQLGIRKAHAIAETGAELVATGNIGCLVQLEKHCQTNSRGVTILHTVQILDRAYQEILG